MAITADGLTPLDLDRSLHGADDSWVLAKSDANFLEHPDRADEQVVTKGISINIDTEAITVIMASGYQRTIAAGELAPGAIHPIHIKKLLSSGTGATVVVRGWF